MYRALQKLGGRVSHAAISYSHLYLSQTVRTASTLPGMRVRVCVHAHVCACPPLTALN